MAGTGRILVVKLSAIGDCLHASPVAQALRQTFPEAHIGWAVHTHCAPVVRGNPFLDRVHEWHRHSKWRSLLTVQKELRAERYDIAIDLQGLLKSGLIGWVSGAKKRYGPSEAREHATIFYTHLLPANPERQVVTQYLLRSAEIGARWDVEPPMFFPFDDSHRETVRSLVRQLGVSDDEVLVALNPSAGRVIKQWPPERFGEVADRLIRELGVRPVITGAKSDRELADRILAASSLRSDLLDLTGRTTLPELAALLERCDLFVGGDTGPMHMAQAVGCRVLALFGPTDPHVLGPRGSRDRLLYKKWECAPCRHKVCPIGDLCLRAITVDEVFESARSMLEESP